MTDTPSDPANIKRQMLYWRLLATLFEKPQQNLDTQAQHIADEVDMPRLLLDPQLGIETTVKHHPELGPAFDNLMPEGEVSEEEAASEEALQRALLFSKLMLSVFGPKTANTTITAQAYNEWLKDVAALERAFGCQPGELRGGSASGGGGVGNPHAGTSGYEISEAEIIKGLEAMERDLIDRMALHEILSDNELVAKVTPSMALVEQLLRDKANLSGLALKNAKHLIQRYVDELAQVLKLEVERTKTKRIDRSIPPKRVFSNLDLQRTIWKNLTNWDPESERLYVDRLYYHHGAAKAQLSKRLIIVVDQSGSMIDSMVNCAILASIFAGLPRVDPHLIAYDTNMIDLTAWVRDPFEVLMRTNLGGGNDWKVAMAPARDKIIDPQETAIVWISDFYEIEVERMIAELRGLQRSGVTILPVGSVMSSGYFSVNPWFKQQFKEMGTPLISGSVKTLIHEIKTFVSM